jgi:hypothetical protein
MMTLVDRQISQKEWRHCNFAFVEQQKTWRQYEEQSKRWSHVYVAYRLPEIIAIKIQLQCIREMLSPLPNH